MICQELETSIIIKANVRVVLIRHLSAISLYTPEVATIWLFSLL